MSSSRVSVDLTLRDGLTGAAHAAAAAEEAGCRGLWIPETLGDPFLPAVPVLGATTSLQAGTGIAVAFARSPMTIAQQAHDLQMYSGGRFLLGIGSQIKTHITKRFSMPWGPPAEKMREMVGALHAIFAHWYDGERLDFRGKHYQHTFNADVVGRRPPEALRPPPIYLAGVGPQMTQLAGEVADGFLAHGFCTESYLRSVLMPRLDAGRARQSSRGSGRAPESPFELVVTPLAAVGTGQQLEAGVAAVRRSIALYGSTPAYRPVLDHHGLGSLQDELHALSTQGRWQDMPALIDDETLRLFAVVGSAEDVARQLWTRYGNLSGEVRLRTESLEVARTLHKLASQTNAFRTFV